MIEARSVVIRGSRIQEDVFGHLCLDDLWKAAKAKESKAPSKWRLSRMAQALIQELEKKIQISSLKENKPVAPSLYAKRGRGSTGTFAHPILAAAYAGYLSPKLELEVREVWLRYRSGDATLADEILERATAEENRWAGARALSRGQRVSYTDTLKSHYVTGRGYMDCTEAVYLRLLGGKSLPAAGISRVSTQGKRLEISSRLPNCHSSWPQKPVAGRAHRGRALKTVSAKTLTVNAGSFFATTGLADIALAH